MICALHVCITLLTSIIVYMPTRGCLSFFFFFLFLHDALSQLGLGHQNETIDSYVLKTEATCIICPVHRGTS